MAAHHNTLKLSPRKLNAALNLLLTIDLAVSTCTTLLKRAQRQLRAAIRTVLAAVHFNKAAAAKVLGISRSGLYAKLKDIDLGDDLPDIPEVVGEPPKVELHPSELMDLRWSKLTIEPIREAPKVAPLVPPAKIDALLLPKIEAASSKPIAPLKYRVVAGISKHDKELRQGPAQVICFGCGLVQYWTLSGNCRRCFTRLTKEGGVIAS